MGHYDKTLLIGCGGSGIKTLIRLNELLSSNPNYRNDVRESISYLAVDTSRGELNGFVSKIQAQMGGDPSMCPNIATAHITEGVSGLNQIVRSTFDMYKDEPEKLDNLKKHWLFSPDGEPFRGIRIRQVEAGAGQCCQVSYLATWNYMPKLEATLANMVNEIRKRDPGSSRLQVFLIAGLAGGTGRGSWQLIAFKVRQFLEEQGITADITAVFFDATCYPNVPNSKQERENLFVNSYTAMSELAGWMRLKKNLQYDYVLPYLDNPDSEVIHIYNEKDPNRQSPVLQAFLIFGSNGQTGNLENNTQYHNMAATALYSMVVYPDVINAITVNRRMNIGSFGATTFEVDTYHLRSFFETAVQKKFLERQCAELTSSALSGEVDKLIGNVHAPEKDTFLSSNCLWLPETLCADSDDVSLAFRDEDKNLSLLQKLMKERIDGKYVTRKSAKDAGGNDVKVFSDTEKLKKRLQEQCEPKKLNPVIETLLRLSEKRMEEDALTADFAGVLSACKLDRDHLAGTLNQQVLDQFALDDTKAKLLGLKENSIETKEVSLGRCILFTSKLQKCFEKYIAVLKAGIALEGTNDPCTDVEGVIENLKNLIEKAYREDNGFLGMGKKYNDKEIESICSRFQYCMYAAIFFKLKPVLIGYYEQAVGHLEKIGGALRTMVEILKRTNPLLDKNLEPDFGKLSYDEIINELFIDAKSTNSVLRSIPEASAMKNVYYRQLKPIMDSDEIDTLLADTSTVQYDTTLVKETIVKQLQNLLAINDDNIKDKRFKSFDEAKKSLPKELCKFIAANVHLEEKVGNETFMDAHFSFEKVLEKNIERWNKLLKEASSNQRASLKDRFRDFLGVDNEDYDEDNCLENGDDKILKKIILSLVNTCKPWIQVIPGSKLSESLDCTILLPQSIDDPEGFANQIKALNTRGNITMSANIQCPGINENALNLPSDRIVVFNAEILQDSDFAPMDAIQNLTFWRKDSAVNSLLELAESPREGETAWFKFDAGKWDEKPTGMAYVSPIFENEPLKSLRWHPWMKETTVSMEEAQLARANRALFYALLGNGIADDADVKSDLSAFGCEKPLLSLSNQDFNFNYSPRVFDNGKMIKSVVNQSWDVSSSKALHSIDHVVDYLCGKGDVAYQADGGNKFQQSKDSGKKLCDAINSEADAFFENLFPKFSDGGRRLLITSLFTWMTQQANLSTAKDDRPYWNALLEFAKKESENLGVVLR